MRWADHVVRRGEMKGRELGRRRRGWEDNIGMYLREMEWEVVNSIHVVQDKDQWRVVVNTGMKLRFL
jgi:hypothetical protein